MNEKKLCIDCKHCKIVSYKNIDITHHYCGRPERADMVSGGSDRSCSTERYDIGLWRFFSEDCGRIGKYWEAK